jgi:predicted dinucleotide-binding enzyme
MNIAIIGAGNVGRAIAGSSVKAGHHVVVSANDQAHSQAVAAATGATVAASNADAVRGADLVVFAVPFDAIDAIVSDLGSALDGKTVVDVTNRPTPVATGSGTSAAEEIQARIPGAHVIKALNTALAARQAEPTIDGSQLDGYVAGDDAAAKASVLEFVRSIGFRPIDAGPLAVARTLEGMAWLHISLQLQNGWTWQSGWKLVGPTDLAA